MFEWVRHVMLSLAVAALAATGSIDCAEARTANPQVEIMACHDMVSDPVGQSAVKASQPDRESPAGLDHDCSKRCQPTGFATAPPILAAADEQVAPCYSAPLARIDGIDPVPAIPPPRLV